MGHGKCNSLGEYCGLSTASEVFLICTTRLYQVFSVYTLFALLSDEPEVFLPKYSQMAIPHAAHFRRVVKMRSNCTLFTHLNSPGLDGVLWPSGLLDCTMSRGLGVPQ